MNYARVRYQYSIILSSLATPVLCNCVNFSALQKPNYNAVGLHRNLPKLSAALKQVLMSY